NGRTTTITIARTARWMARHRTSDCSRKRGLKSYRSPENLHASGLACGETKSSLMAGFPHTNRIPLVILVGGRRRAAYVDWIGLPAARRETIAALAKHEGCLVGKPRVDDECPSRLSARARRTRGETWHRGLGGLWPTARYARGQAVQHGRVPHVS